MIRFPLFPLSFLLGLLLSALSVHGQTIESVMRALQERHIAVEQREYVQHKASGYNAYDEDFYSGYEAYEVEPIEWVSGVSASPQDGALDALSLDDWLEQMNELRNEYNSLRGEYVFPANSAESSDSELARVDRRDSILRQIEPIDEENFTSLVSEMASGLNQMKYLIWPSMLQYASRDNQRFEDKPSPLDIAVSAFDGDNDWGAGWDWDYWDYWGYGYYGGWYGWDWGYYYDNAHFDILDSYYFSDNSIYSRMSVGYGYTYNKYDRFDEEDGSLKTEDAEVPHTVSLNLHAGNIGFLFFTGSELGGLVYWAGSGQSPDLLVNSYPLNPEHGQMDTKNSRATRRSQNFHPAARKWSSMSCAIFPMILLKAVSPREVPVDRSVANGSKP